MPYPDQARKRWLGKEDESAVLVKGPRCRLSPEGHFFMKHDIIFTLVLFLTFPPIHSFRFTVWFTKYFLPHGQYFLNVNAPTFSSQQCNKHFPLKTLPVPPVRTPWNVLSLDLHFLQFQLYSGHRYYACFLAIFYLLEVSKHHSPITG